LLGSPLFAAFGRGFASVPAGSAKLPPLDPFCLSWTHLRRVVPAHSNPIMVLLPPPGPARPLSSAGLSPSLCLACVLPSHHHTALPHCEKLIRSDPLLSSETVGLARLPPPPGDGPGFRPSDSPWRRGPPPSLVSPPSGDHTPSPPGPSGPGLWSFMVPMDVPLSFSVTPSLAAIARPKRPSCTHLASPRRSRWGRGIWAPWQGKPARLLHRRPARGRVLVLLMREGF